MGFTSSYFHDPELDGGVLAHARRLARKECAALFAARVSPFSVELTVAHVGMTRVFFTAKLRSDRPLRGCVAERN